MQADPVTPARAQQVYRSIPLDDDVQKGATEEVQHRQVALAVPTVCGGVDEHHAAGRPHQVTAPQIAVDSGRRIVIIEITCATTIHHLIEGVQCASVQSRRRALRHGKQSLVGVKLAPAVVFGEAHRQRVL